MKIYPVILTAYRPKSTLDGTIKSLKRAGWSEPKIFDGAPSEGKTCPFGNNRANISLMQQVVNEGREEDALMVVEDDVIFCTGVREYLEKESWPENSRNIAVISPYCPIAYSNHLKPFGHIGRWHKEVRGNYLSGAQVWIYPIVKLPSIIKFLKKTEDGVDSVVGAFALKYKLNVWYHTPSLAQHIGVDGNSSVGYIDCGTIYRADTFPGEDFDARTLS